MKYCAGVNRENEHLQRKLLNLQTKLSYERNIKFLVGCAGVVGLGLSVSIMLFCNVGSSGLM